MMSLFKTDITYLGDAIRHGRVDAFHLGHRDLLLLQLRFQHFPLHLQGLLLLHDGKTAHHVPYQAQQLTDQERLLVKRCQQDHLFLRNMKLLKVLERS